MLYYRTEKEELEKLPKGSIQQLITKLTLPSFNPSSINKQYNIENYTRIFPLYTSIFYSCCVCSWYYRFTFTLSLSLSLSLIKFGHVTTRTLYGPPLYTRVYITFLWHYGCRVSSSSSAVPKPQLYISYINIRHVHDSMVKITCIVHCKTYKGYIRTGELDFDENLLQYFICRSLTL